MKWQRLQNRVTDITGKFPKFHIGLRVSHRFPDIVCLWLYNEIEHPTSTMHTKLESQHIKGKRPKLDGGKGN
jgi:hypothetical protein